MLELLLKSTFVLALALVLVACLPKSQPGLRHGVLLSGLLVLPLLVLVVWLPPLVALPLLVDAPPRADTSPSITKRLPPPRQVPSVYTAASSPVRERASVVFEKPAPANPAPRHNRLGAALGFGGYGLVALGLLVRILRDRYALAGLLRRATPAERLAPYPVLLTTQPLVPLACGIVRRRILLPHAALSWDQERLRAVLLHESAHLSRHDPLCQLLAELICALFWCHPLVWLTVRQLRQEAESACDRHVLANGIAPDRYAHYLLEIVKMLKKQPSAPAMARTPRLETRVHAILGYLPTRPTRSAVFTVALIGVATVPLLAARPAVVRQSDVPVKSTKPTTQVATLSKKQVTPDIERARPDQAKAAAEKKATKLASADNKAKLADEKALQEKRQRELQALAQRDRDIELQRADADRQLTKLSLRLDENIARARERQTRDLETESLDEELEELKLKLRNLDSRLTDKQLELAAMTASMGPQQERVQATQRQIEVLTKMMNEVRAQRNQIRAKLQEVAEDRRVQQQKRQIEEQEKVLVGIVAELEDQERMVEQKAKQVQSGIISVDELNKEQAKLKEIKARYQTMESRLKRLRP